MCLRAPLPAVLMRLRSTDGVEEMFMKTNAAKLAARAYLVLVCTGAPVAMVHAQTGAAGTVAGQPAGTAGQGAAGGAGAGGAGVGGTGGVGTAGAGNGGAAAGGGDLGYAQAQDNGNRGGGSKAGWLGLLGLLGLLGMRRRVTGTTTVRDAAPSYETTGAGRS